LSFGTLWSLVESTSECDSPQISLSACDRLVRLEAILAQALDFHEEPSDYASHNYHSFPAKFPPQLPRIFIEQLTAPGETVLDPMVGSGTTLVEAALLGRFGVGADIDPLARLLCAVKTRPLDYQQALRVGHQVLSRAHEFAASQPDSIHDLLVERFGIETADFIDYWFPADSQVELFALANQIGLVQELPVRQFLTLTFSATVIGKTPGITRARDLSHTRPHRVKAVVPKSPLVEFKRRLDRNVAGLKRSRFRGQTSIIACDAQQLPLANDSIDLAVTSPPYAANAIDYMRAHKFSLVWFGHPLPALSAKRGEYIGGEATRDFEFVAMPDGPARMVERIARADAKKGRVLHRYLSEMSGVLDELRRVLKPGRSAVLVVGSSSMRGIDTQTPECLGEIAQAAGFTLAGIATRRLDRNRRLMPARQQGESDSQIEQRMFEEFVIGLFKPERETNE